MKTGAKVYFEDLFTDYEKDKDVILKTIYKTLIEESADAGQEGPVCNTLEDLKSNSHSFSLFAQKSELIVTPNYPHASQACKETVIIPIKELLPFTSPDSILRRVTAFEQPISKVDTKYQVISLILDSAFEKKYFSKAPMRCFDADIQNSGILNEAGDPFVYFEIYIVGDPSDTECISNVNSLFTVDKPLHTVLNLKTQEVIIESPDEFNPCFGIPYGECKE